MVDDKHFCLKPRNIRACKSRGILVGQPESLCKKIFISFIVLSFSPVFISYLFAENTEAISLDDPVESTSEVSMSKSQQRPHEVKELKTKSSQKSIATPLIAEDLPVSAPQNVTVNFNNIGVDVDSYSGAALAMLPIIVPVGRKGIQPSINLYYSSNRGNGILGVGWILDLGSIKRSTKNGPPAYDSSDSFIFSINGTTEELVSIGGGEYRQRIEEEFRRFYYDGNYWVITDKAGTKYYLGQDDSSRIFHASYGTFEWCLNKIEDVHGNYLTITYLRDQNQLYPRNFVSCGPYFTCQLYSFRRHQP